MVRKFIPGEHIRIPKFCFRRGDKEKPYVALEAESMDNFLGKDENDCLLVCRFLSIPDHSSEPDGYGMHPRVWVYECITPTQVVVYVPASIAEFAF